MSILSFWVKKDKIQNVRINSPIEKRKSKNACQEEQNIFLPENSTTIITQREVVVNESPKDYFGGNRWIKGKTISVLTPLKINVYKAYVNGVPVHRGDRDSFCFAIAETEDYLFYNYGCYYDGSGGSVLRQTKNNPKEVVFFGEAKLYNCTFHNHLIQVPSCGRIGQMRVWIKDINTGKERICQWFGKYAKPVVDGHCAYNQDSVSDMYIDDERDAIILTVKRRFCENGDSADPEYVCNANTNYILEIKYSNGEFFAIAHYPKLNVIQKFENS